MSAPQLLVSLFLSKRRMRTLLVHQPHGCNVHGRPLESARRDVAAAAPLVAKTCARLCKPCLQHSYDPNLHDMRTFKRT
jgi:hypothetical protein